MYDIIITALHKSVGVVHPSHDSLVHVLTCGERVP